MNKSNSVELFKDGNKLKTRIKPTIAISEVFENSFPTGTLKDILDNLEEHVRNVVRLEGWIQPSNSAFSNTRGSWFEMIVAAVAWNYRIERGIPEYYIVKMPNVKVFELYKIFRSDTQKALDSLEEFLQGHGTTVSLITPNPDLIIIQNNALPVSIDSNTHLSNLRLENSDRVNSFYKEIKGKCPWESVRAGIGLTTSLRPDRRLQLVHEGNILKSIFAHLKTRNWNNSINFEYHGASSEGYSKADETAFRTAATHTIANINSIPERAVSELHSLLTINDICTMFDKIIKRTSPLS